MTSATDIARKLSVEFIFLLTDGYQRTVADVWLEGGGGNAPQVVLAAVALRASQANENGRAI